MEPISHQSLSERLERALPLETQAFLQQAVELATQRGWKIYIEGGFVRDLLLERPHYDLDISVEGDAIALAHELQAQAGARVEATTRFGTAYIEFGKSEVHNLDMVTARREWYEAPGALPTVEPGTILDDLARRDFTINAMAIPLGTEGAGPLLDPHGGSNDLQAQLVRVLHSKSFIDDPTRIPRAVKYSVRLGFKIEKQTLELILQAIRDGALATVSTDRLVHELLLIMEEHKAGAMLAELEKLGVLRAIHPELSWQYGPYSKFGSIGEQNIPSRQRHETYIAILGAEHAGFPEDAAQLARSLGLGAHLIRIMQDAALLAHLWPRLGEANLMPSQVYELLHNLDLKALQAFTHIKAMSVDQLAWERLHEYIDRSRHVKPLLRGDYLQRLGVPPGPVYKEVLNDLLEAKLDGKVTAREDEEKFISEWLGKRGIATAREKPQK